jgi:hypothetical protein
MSSASAFAGLCSSLPPASAFTISYFTKQALRFHARRARWSRKALRPRLALRSTAWPKRITGRRHSPPTAPASHGFGVSKIQLPRPLRAFAGFRGSAAGCGLSSGGAHVPSMVAQRRCGAHGRLYLAERGGSDCSSTRGLSQPCAPRTQQISAPTARPATRSEEPKHEVLGHRFKATNARRALFFARVSACH